MWDLFLVNYSTEYVLSYRWDSRGLFRSDEEAEFKIVPAQVIRVSVPIKLNVFELFLLGFHHPGSLRGGT